MGWDISVSERIYHKLANELLFKIINGTIPMGSKLSPASALVREANTSQDTMRKALCVLIERRVISKTYRGYFVTNERQAGRAARMERIREFVEQRETKFAVYDDAITRKFVEQITALNAETIRIKFRYPGLEVDKSLN